MDLADKLSKRLLEVDSGCWEFVGAVSGSGYGSISIGYKTYTSTHVLAYELTNGPVPKGMVVRHTCNNKICCNPDHLIIGTYQDNKDDEILAGTHIKGSRQGQSKLHEDDIPVIRKLISDGFSVNEIAALYAVSGTAIYYIRTKQNWGWL